jgi:hypothetical protein
MTVQPEMSTRTPASGAPASQTPKPKKRSTCLTCGIVFFVLIAGLLCCLSLAGAAAFYLYSTGQSGSNLSLMGYYYSFTTGDVSVVNLTDGDLEVRIDMLEAAPGMSMETEFNERNTLESFEISGFGTVPAGSHLVVFNSPQFPVELSCRLRIQNGEDVQFVAVPEGITITSDRYPAITAEELNILTSGKCR